MFSQMRLASGLARSTLRPSLQPMQKFVRPAALVGVRSLGGMSPGIPGGIVGTVNDAVAVPPPSRTHGSYHWSFERLVAASLVPLTIAPFATGVTPVVDAVLGSLLIVHSHIGLEGCIIDYIPERVYGKTINRLATYALYGGSIAALIALYEYETNDIGLTETVKKVWKA